MDDVSVTAVTMEEDMSLLDAFYKKYTIMDHVTADDPEGGIVISGWRPGATVDMALDDPTQAQQLIAESQRLEVVRNAVFPIGTPVAYGAYLRSVDDESLIYRVQSDPVNAPGPAGIQIMKAEVMKSRLPA